MVTEMRLDRIPLEMGPLTGEDLRFEQSVYQELNADGNVFRNYLTRDGQIANVYIGYYGTAKGGRASHVPQYCYTGQGWAIEKWDLTSLDASPRGPRPINRLIVNRGAERMLVYFWFQTESVVMATGVDLNVNKFLGRLFHNRSDGALVRVSMRIPAGQDQETEDTTKGFSHMLIPLISKFWPVEQAVGS